MLGWQETVPEIVRSTEGTQDAASPLKFPAQLQRVTNQEVALLEARVSPYSVVVLLILVVDHVVVMGFLALGDVVDLLGLLEVEPFWASMANGWKGANQAMAPLGYLQVKARGPVSPEEV